MLLVGTAIYAVAAIWATVLAVGGALQAYDAALNVYTIEIAGTTKTLEVEARSEAELTATMRRVCTPSDCSRATGKISASPLQRATVAAKAGGIIAIQWLAVYAAFFAAWRAGWWVAKGFRPDAA